MTTVLQKMKYRAYPHSSSENGNNAEVWNLSLMPNNCKMMTVSIALTPFVFGRSLGT